MSGHTVVASSTNTSTATKIAHSNVNAVQVCPCTLQNNESIKIQCFANHYRNFMFVRQTPLSERVYKDLLDTTSMANLQLPTIHTTNFTAQLAECQILYTFIEQYTRTHPRFVSNVQQLGDMKIKKHFYSST
jgi:hypothetical protein